MWQVMWQNQGMTHYGMHRKKRFQQKQTKKELTKHQILVSSVGGSRRIRTIDLPGMNTQFIYRIKKKHRCRLYPPEEHPMNFFYRK